MKRMLAALALVLALPVCAQGEVRMTELADSESGSRLVVFSAQADTIDLQAGKEPALDPVMMAINAQIEVRFAQEQAKKAMERAGATVLQRGTLYQDGKIASMSLLWQGEQADGREGSRAEGLTVNLETGMEIYLDELLTDYEGAIAAMESIIADDVLENMSDYMEYSELLPMPTDSYSISETGLTIYWPEDRYRYFDGACGSVTFYWHELADYIGEESPVYGISRIQEANEAHLDEESVFGILGNVVNCRLGITLGNAAEQYKLADPDYTTDALVYPLERVRGYSLEIPKYSELDEDETPISAIRASRISVHGLTTGKTTREEIVALLGEPQKTLVYDEDAAFDALLEPGESLLYTYRHVVQLHLDEDGVLSCVILRETMPESLY